MTAPFTMAYIDTDDEFVRVAPDHLIAILEDFETQRNQLDWFDAVEGLAGSCPHPDCALPEDAPACPCDDDCDGGDDCRCGWKLAQGYA